MTNDIILMREDYDRDNMCLLIYDANICFYKLNISLLNIYLS